MMWKLEVLLVFFSIFHGITLVVLLDSIVIPLLLLLCWWFRGLIVAADYVVFKPLTEGSRSCSREPDNVELEHHF